MRVLLLAGTAEAREVARALADCGVDAVASLAGATRAPAALPLPTRIGGFGGAAPFADYLVGEGIGAVLDATHPFAARIGPRSARVCAELTIPYMRLLRPEWSPGPGDRWTMLESLGAAAGAIPEGASVFVATGRQAAAELCLPGRSLHVRVIDLPEVPQRGLNYITGRPPSRKRPSFVCSDSFASTGC